MKFDKGIAAKYRRSIEDALETIFEVGDDSHRQIVRLILESEMLVSVQPVSRVRASGITGLRRSFLTGMKLKFGRFDLLEAFGEVFITVAEETIDTGGQRGCEGTLVHEGRHAFDFARVVESLSFADVRPSRLYDPTLYELEWNAHVAAGEYMLLNGRDEYLEEGVQLMILERDAGGRHVLSEAGIRRRLGESYGLDAAGNPGRRASRILGLIR